ncbi:3,4-dihydroxy-2-butanone-4-phosphate synthase [Bradyrhizobium genosp. SA-3]|uniref:3,4-dihydroxy-2-butanone-4-phosphate synthase n=1 Tax=Bradyrhizobium genosp. SA-3 TaxID=508868 RepID=UPI001028F85A|nr:3,4-dihydroxy-2-butanone-4-phosphate synthase [Bradyrhizobium genosp. SA-3]RZN09488.1 3,4-dihydroxy-2-butanone-4-phosphate synthase [Bradyrhizobium genosp. SA-3]
MMASISAALKAFSEGEIVVVADDDDREGEGDLVVAASLCSTERMAFIIRHTSGIVCAPITLEQARRLRLDPMVVHNESNHTTAFTVSIDYKPDGGTGISAEERASCCRALANCNVSASDFARPGHIFPLISKEGGVLMRSGHTEAAVDLCRLTKLAPVGVISELMNDDGSVMKGSQVRDFAARHALKYVTIADIIGFRQAREKLVERVSSVTADSPIGPLQGYSYRTPFDPIHHVAYVYGGIGDGKNVLTRFYKPNIIRDMFSGEAQAKMNVVLQRFKENGSGVLVYLRDGAAGVPPAPLLPSSSSDEHRDRQWREIGVGAQILRDLGIASIRHLTSSTHHFKGLAGFGIEIIKNEQL